MVQSGGKILMDSGTMAASGYPTWDIAVVMDDFAAKYPEFVTKFVKSECAAVDYWLEKPEETAAMIAKELSLPIDDSRRMMKGTEMVSCDKQLSEAYLGTTKQKGKFVDTLMSTATFSDRSEAPAEGRSAANLRGLHRTAISRSRGRKIAGSRLLRCPLSLLRMLLRPRRICRRGPATSPSPTSPSASADRTSGG